MSEIVTISHVYTLITVQPVPEILPQLLLVRTIVSTSSDSPCEHIATAGLVYFSQDFTKCG